MSKVVTATEMLDAFMGITYIGDDDYLKMQKIMEYMAQQDGYYARLHGFAEGLIWQLPEGKRGKLAKALHKMADEAGQSVEYDPDDDDMADAH